MAILNTPNIGAGGTYGPIKDISDDSANLFSTYSDCDSKAAAAGVNAYSGVGGETVYPYGDDKFEVTVIHNALHSLLVDSIDTPSDGCSQDHSNHSLGEITSYNNVSPAQIWYTTAIASGNPPPCDNCSGNPEQEANGAITDISSCTEDALAPLADVLGT